MKTGDLPFDSQARAVLISGAVFAGLAVAAGAFGAHALEGRVPEARLETFETAVRYHMYHALGLLVVGALSGARPVPALRAAGILFGVGIVLFSGSLYALVLLDQSRLALITPFGGVAFIAGWAALAWGVGRLR